MGTFFETLRELCLSAKFHTRKLGEITKCGNTTKTITNYLLHCLNLKHERQSVQQNVGIINSDCLFMNEETLTFLLLYDDNSLTDRTNTILLNSVTENVTEQNVLKILSFCNH